MTELIAIQPHIWIFPHVTVVFAGLFFLFRYIAKRDVAKQSRDNPIRYYPRTEIDSGWFFGVVFAGIFALGGVIATSISLIPYNVQYWSLYRVSGTIESVTNVLDNGSGELSTTPVVMLVGHDTPILVDQSRVMGLVGRDVDLTCSIQWVPYGLDQYRCGIAAIR